MTVGTITTFINENKVRVDRLLSFVPFQTRLGSRLELEKSIFEMGRAEEEPLELGFVDKIFIEDVFVEDYERTATEKDVIAYAEVFCRMMNSVFEEENKRFYPKSLVFSPGIIDLDLYYGAPEQIEVKTIDKDITDIPTGEPQYARNIVCFRKPKQFRHWLRVQAITDADRVFADAVKAELKR